MDGQNKEQQTAGPNKPTSENKETSRPPSIIVNVLPPQESETEKNQKRKERDKKVSLDQWSLESTVAIAFFTGVLALSAILLWLDTRKSGNAATKAANAAQKATDATARTDV